MKRFMAMLLCILMVLGVFVTPSYAAEPAPGVTTSKELESYLNNNFGTLTTNLKTFDLKGTIYVTENHDQYKCYDMVVMIGWDSLKFEVRDILNSIDYTDAQKEEFKDSLKNYQKSIADISIATFPEKKIRGGFLSWGWQYPNLKIGYYEGAVFGWKNYKYTQRLLNYYNDTYVDSFHWFSFGESGTPKDYIN